MKILNQKIVALQVTTSNGETVKGYVEDENGSITMAEVQFDLKVAKDGDPESEERTVYIDGVSEEVVTRELTTIQESLLS